MSTPSWGRTPDPRNGQSPWLWPMVVDARSREPAPSKPVRIGDAERDEAVSALGEHFAAGRLTREELDERIDQAMQARFSTDLEPLFDDLPASPRLQPERPEQRVRPGPPQLSPLAWVLPLVVVAAVLTAVLIGAPWVLWGVVWFFVLGRFWSRGWGNQPHHHHRPGPPPH
jgi:DUF1707 SHOCT-like domain